MAALAAVAVAAAEHQVGGNMKRILTESENKQIEERIAQLERKTSGEVVVAVARRSSSYSSSAMLLSSIAALLLSIPLVNVAMDVLYRPDLAIQAVNMQMILYIPIFLCVLAAARVLINRFPALLAPAINTAKKQQKVQERSAWVFYENRLYNTKEGTGVLLYISLYERTARILADAGIYQKIGQDGLQDMAEKLALGIRQGRGATAILESLDVLENVLATNFPPPEKNENELPDAVLYY